jgi:predicted dehydrogenase
MSVNLYSTRRTFLGAAAAASGLASTALYAKPQSAIRGPNDTINLALIGCGARGRGLLIPSFQKLPGTRFVAVCDVNSKYLAEGRQRAGGDRVAAHEDYRKLLEDKNIDAVIIASNQQWHVPQMIAACQAGKDVYLEKPLGNSIGEGPFAIRAAKKYGRIVQVGTQQRSQQHYQQAVKEIQSGKLGEISEVRVWDYENYFPGDGSPADCAPPSELNWDFYVGPSPYRAYNPNMYYNYGYDWFRIAGAGHQVAWGVHHFDIVLWAMGVTAPLSVYATGGNFAFESNHDYPNTFSATLTFGPGPVSKRGFVLHYTMRTGCRREMRAHSKCFMGTKGSMILDRAGYSIVNEVPRGGKVTSTGPYVNAEETVKAEDDHLYHFELWLKNLRDRKTPEANPETCHHATAVGHLMNISWETGRSIRWDGTQVIGDPKANALVMRPYRAPWKLKV